MDDSKYIIQLIYRRDYLKEKHLSTRSREILLEYRHTIETRLQNKSGQVNKSTSIMKLRNTEITVKQIWKELNRIQGSGKHESSIPTELSMLFEWFFFFFFNVGKNISKSFQHNVFE